VISYAEIFLQHEVDTLAEAQAVMVDQERLETLEGDLRRVPGDGAYGIRRGYLWMLVGDDDRIKPDRMVLRWLRRHGFTGDVPAARELIRGVAGDLSSQDSPVTPWMVDRAIWKAERSRSLAR